MNVYPSQLIVIQNYVFVRRLHVISHDDNKLITFVPQLASANQRHKERNMTELSNSDQDSRD